jgi:hypothetical protein
MERKLSAEQERERLARWLSKGKVYIPPSEKVYDPRNEDDFDTWSVGMEPIPGDHTWVKEKAPNGAF